MHLPLKHMFDKSSNQTISLPTYITNRQFMNLCDVNDLNAHMSNEMQLVTGKVVGVYR